MSVLTSGGIVCFGGGASGSAPSMGFKSGLPGIPSAPNPESAGLSGDSGLSGEVSAAGCGAGDSEGPSGFYSGAAAGLSGL